VPADIEARLLHQARSPEDAAALQRFDSAMTIPLVLAALLPLFLLSGQTNSALADAIVIASWIVFVVDFVVHERRLVHYLHTWWGRFDLTVVVVTAPWFLVVGPSNAKFVMIARLARLARLIMATKGARRLFARLGKVAAVAATVVLTGSAIAYFAEHPTNPEFKTFGDALWWGVVTFTTVGYGDVVPDTRPGRLAGVMIMIMGIAMLGILAGSMASFFHLDVDESAEPPSEIEGLRQEVARLADEIAQLRDAQ
jgi:voltage-gated potassium channel